MSCCGGSMEAESVRDIAPAGDFTRAESLLHAGRPLDDGTTQYVFSAPDIHCGACVATIERTLKQLEGISHARVNLSLRRVTFHLDPEITDAVTIADTLARLGFPVQPVDIGDLDDIAQKRTDRELLKSLAVAGFASMNIMLLSVSVWSGADGSTRDLFHLISALIAIPAVIYAGRVFFKSAFGALRSGRVNMDVPIALAITLATGMSVFEALTGGAEAYFEASTMLLFFLLIGRYLDQRMRDRVRNAVVQLSRLSAKGANVVDGNATHYVPLDELTPGMVVRVRPGERLPVDATVLSGQSDVDRSIVTGESAPVPALPGRALEAGTLNLTGPLDATVTKSADASFLAEVRQMMDAAENGRGHYVRLADRMARLYAPFVHSMAALAFVGWMFATGGDWHTSLYVAISLLIITCPCALGLAVPVVHVIGATKLFEAGILMKDGSALERMATIDHAVFDKTGTLTTGTPVIEASDIDRGMEERIAVALASASIHPGSRALLQSLQGVSTVKLKDVREVPGSGVEGVADNRKVRLGRAEWVAEIASASVSDGETSLAFGIEGQPLRSICLGETLRDDANATIRTLSASGIESEILSGDATSAVTRLAAELGVTHWTANVRPEGKIARVKALQDEGRRVLVVGDGLNDAPALAAGHVSMAPSSGSDVGRMAADFVFTRDSLSAVTIAHDVAARADRLVKQNFALAFGYNLIAIPIAVAGLVTPLVAALAMSASSIVVVANSMRLARQTGARKAPKTGTAHRVTSRLEPAE